MKNKVVNYNNILGNTTYEDLVTKLKYIIKQYQLLEEIVYNILKYNNYDDEIIASLFASNINTNLIDIYNILISLL